MSTLAQQVFPEQAGHLPPAAELDRVLHNASPAEVIESALRIVGREHLALVSSFGTESAALLKVMADVDPAIPVIFLDTGWLFEETLAYRDTLVAKLGLRDVRSIKPLQETLSSEDPQRELWFSDPDACCRIRKVEPLKRALAPFRGWINGRKRFQGGLRADIPVVEDDGARLKFNPFANVSREAIEAIYTGARLPPHPLAAMGYLSVGCMPCTRDQTSDVQLHIGESRDSGFTLRVPRNDVRNWSSVHHSATVGMQQPTSCLGNLESCARRSRLSGYWRSAAARRRRRSSSPACISAWPMAAPNSIRWPRPR